MNQKSKRFAVSFSFLTLSLSIAWFGHTQLSLASYRDDFPEFDGTLIDQDETWTKDGQYVFDKQVAIVDGVKLTIEPGTTVSFGRGADGTAIPFQIWDGVVEAVGTEAEPIVFQREGADGAFFIDFNNDNETLSVFKYVRFLRGGDAWWVDVCTDCQQSFLEKFFIGRALAAQERAGTETLKYWYGKLRIENSVFSDSAFLDVSVSDSRINDITDDRGTFIRKDPSFLFIVNSDFSGDTTVPALQVYDDSCLYFALNCQRKISFENNWYGAMSGPQVVSNSAGTGKMIQGTINLNNWSTAQFFCVEQCYSNVLFLPGLEASRLYIPDGADGYQVWEPFENSDAMKLYLDADGKSENPNIYTKDIVDNAYIPIKGNIYKSFIEEMNAMRDSQLINDWQATPYDWRLTLDDIVNNGTVDGDAISYIQSTSTPYIVQELKRLATTSKSGKVTIVAHSNGGLVAKAIIKKLGETEAARLIDKLVLVAVPQSGTPQAIGALLHGYDQGLPKDWMPFFLSSQTARILAHNMPGVYPLLPTESYFSGEGSGVDTPPITFEDGAKTNTFIGAYGHGISDVTELQSFLLDTMGKVPADSDNLVAPSTVNPSLLAYGQGAHQDLDTAVIPETIAVYEIAGFGEETLGAIRYWTGTTCAVATNDGRCVQYDTTLQYTPDMVVDGDGTVVAPSALALSAGLPNAQRYWVNLEKYDTFLNLKREHADILEVSSLRDFIREKIITQSSSAFPSFISDSEPPTSSEKRLRYYLHSPLVLSAHDNAGNEISATTATLPGARFKRFGEVQYISLPASAHPTLVLDGEATGSFTLEVEEVEGNVVIVKTIFAGIPSTADTRVTIDFPDGTIGQALPLAIDYDGNGAVDHEVVPIINGTATLGNDTDTTPPTTKVALTGMQGTNGWYTSDVTVTLTAMDNEGGSGVEKIKYSLDGGITENVYTDPFVISAEGTTTILFASTDKAGNKEETKTQTLKIDKTAPEAKVAFSPTAQKLSIIGTDNLGGDVGVVVTELLLVFVGPHLSDHRDKSSEEHRNKQRLSVTLTDDAGHVTDITLVKFKEKQNDLSFQITSIAYDITETRIMDTSSHYQWEMNRKRQYQELETQLTTETRRLESRYMLKSNETWIREQAREHWDDEDEQHDRDTKWQKLPGMIIPSLLTEQGNIRIVY